MRAEDYGPERQHELMADYAETEGLVEPTDN